MRRALVVAVLLVGCAACRDGQAPAGGGGSVEGELRQIESTLDAVESELAGD